jgi:hypothetical protein
MALAILGAWLGATVLMWVIASGSFRTVDRVLRAPDPQFKELTGSIGPGQTRSMLRYLASEINRTCFNAYGWGQIVLGMLLFIVLWRQAPHDIVALIVASIMLGLALVLTLIITPKIVVLGRMLDFVPRNPPPPGMAHFRTLHISFTGLDGAKFLAGLGLLLRWVAKR